MAIMRWSPFADLIRVQDQMNRVFDDAMRRPSDEPSLDRAWSPPVDIYEDSEGFVIKAELPELKKSDITLKVEDNTLTLSGERKFENEETKENYHTIERFYGKFSRSFSLPDTVDQAKIAAKSKDGVLRIDLPKKAETQPRSVEISVN